VIVALAKNAIAPITRPARCEPVAAGAGPPPVAARRWHSRLVARRAPSSLHAHALLTATSVLTATCARAPSQSLRRTGLRPPSAVVIKDLVGLERQ